jgi:DNA-directed RNA polymerase specialized sigma subunit
MFDFKGLVAEIEMHQSRIETCKENIKEYQKLMNRNKPREVSGICIDGLPKGSMNMMPFGRILECIRIEESLIEVEEKNLERLIKQRDDIIARVDTLKGLEKQVIMRRDIYEMSLAAIAKELGYSEARIKQISAKYPINK